MFKEIIKINKKEMEKVYSTYIKKISKINTGRISIKILDDILIKYNNSFVNLKKISNITVINYNTIKINLFDFSLSNIVKNTIIKSNLNLSVFITNNDIIVTLPQINEKRRKEFIKIIRYKSENSRIIIRAIRRESNLKIKNLFIKKKITLDEKKYAENKIQNLTDKFITQINSKLIKKEKELLLI
ncbi:MAG: ribosome recycling factor [Enterobacteriaceae bacterium PSpyr]|nr:MAG: ribosome recycling factor [Enterobacteriaceae bacterium PSpyr]